MAARNPLIAGGTHKGFSAHPGTFITHTIPEIHKNTIIVAATHPTVQTGKQTADGWFLSDFYAFNYLLKGIVSDQTWLTAADPETLLSQWGDYLHGFPRRDRKVVLSHDLLKSDITPVTVVEPAIMIDKFLEEVKKASTRARHENCPLLLIIFCYGIDNHHFLLDNGLRHKGLTMVRLKEALEPGVKVTLFTTACYSGGWAITPDLNITAMTAAAAREESISCYKSASMGRYCGSVFAGATISTLSAASSPLLAQDRSNSLPLQIDQEEDYLQPREPTEAQTESYNEFCRTITNTLDAQGISRILGNNFQFSAQDDQWEYSWTGLSGIPLAYFSKRWENLASYAAPPSQGDSDDEAIPDHLTGSPEACIDDMTSMMVRSRVRGMADLFLRLCPGDWNRGVNVALGGQFWEFLHDKPDAPSVYEIANIIYFRWDTCQLVDQFVEDHRLRRPNDQICILWAVDENRLAKSQQPDYNDSEELSSKVWRALLEGGAKIEPAIHQGPLFARPHKYMTYAITESSTTWEEAAETIEAYCNYVTRIREFHLQQAIASQAVRRLSRQWLKSIGRRIRRSLSPSKSPRTSLSRGIDALNIGEGTISTTKKLEKTPVIPQPQDRGQDDQEEI